MVYKRVYDFFRTDPVGETALALEGLLCANNLYELTVYIPHNNPAAVILHLAGLLPNLFVVGIAAWHSNRMFGNKKCLEESIKEDGLDENRLEKFFAWWCDRQVAKLVLGRLGYSEEYKKVYKKYKEEGKMHHSWFPNI